MDNFLTVLQKDFPELSFVKSDSYYWSPRNNRIYYRSSDSSLEATWPLLHEIGHAQLGHQRYTTDFNLLTLEIEAWEHAKQLSKKYNHEISENHIQDCLDTYRNWLHKRSTCPKCISNSLQINTDIYRCFNCNNEWRVSASRKCRTYRKIQKASSTEAF